MHLQEWEASTLGYKTPLIIDKRQITREGVPRFYQNEVPTLNATMWKDPYLVLAIPKSTNTQSKYMKGTSMTHPTSETSQKSTQTNYQTSTASWAASHAKHFLSQGSEKDLKTREGHSSSTLREYCEQNNLDYSSLKTLKDFSVTTVDELSKPSSKRLMNWGTTANGKCLTLRTSESHKTGKGSTLSDILEEHPDPKYFLSQEQTKKILSKSTTQPTQTT